MCSNRFLLIPFTNWRSWAFNAAFRPHINCSLWIWIFSLGKCFYSVGTNNLRMFSQSGEALCIYTETLSPFMDALLMLSNHTITCHLWTSLSVESLEHWVAFPDHFDDLLKKKTCHWNWNHLKHHTSCDVNMVYYRCVSSCGIYRLCYYLLMLCVIFLKFPISTCSHLEVGRQAKVVNYEGAVGDITSLLKVMYKVMYSETNQRPAHPQRREHSTSTEQMRI